MDDSHWAIPWKERPVEEARIFNPAFCGELIYRTACEFHHTRRTTLNMVTAFLVLPLTLHEPTRKALPLRANTVYAGWVAQHSALLAELPGRIRRLRPISREALLFAVHHHLLSFDNGGGLLPGRASVRRASQIFPNTHEVTTLRGAASLLGRWFGRQSTQASILQGMGVRP